MGSGTESQIASVGRTGSEPSLRLFGWLLLNTLWLGSGVLPGGAEGCVFSPLRKKQAESFGLLIYDI